MDNLVIQIFDKNVSKPTKNKIGYTIYAPFDIIVSEINYSFYYMKIKFIPPPGLIAKIEMFGDGFRYHIKIKSYIYNPDEGEIYIMIKLTDENKPCVLIKKDDPIAVVILQKIENPSFEIKIID